MPPMWLQVLRFNPAEGQKKHCENAERLQATHYSRKKRTVPVKTRNGIIYKKNGCSRRHSDRKHPFSY